MFLEKLKENKSYSKIILLIAALMLVMALLPMHAHAASAVKTRKVKMRVGQSIQLQLKGVTEPLKWKSLNRKKLSVDSNGLITAKRKGTATIRVRYNGVKYKFIVTIRKRKKNQSTNIRTVTMKLKKSATSAATTDETPDDEEELTTAKYAGIKTTATGSFPQNKIIMVGDSRFVGMSASVSNSSTWHLGNVNNYISYMNALGEQLREKGATVYFMTVNPIDDKTAKKKGYEVRNASVISFDKKMAAGLRGFGIIDTYDELVFEGFSTVDGVHYTADTYRKIYSYMYSCIGA